MYFMYDEDAEKRITECENSIKKIKAIVESENNQTTELQKEIVNLLESLTFSVNTLLTTNHRLM